MLAVPLAGAVEATGDPWLPFRVTDPCGAVVESVSAYFRDLQAAGRSDATLRSYGMDLLRWFRFLWAVEVAWNRATRIEARDFCRWMLVSGKPSRPHWRRPHEVPDRSSTAVAYSASVRAHTETVLRGFYEFHLAAGSGPIVNPFPLHRSRRRQSGARASQSDGAAPQGADRVVSTNGAVPDSAQHPRRGVQRDLRPAALEQGPGTGGVLRLHRSPRVGAAVGHAGRCGSRSAGDRGGAQYIGAYAAVLGRVDAVAFTAGIREHSPPVELLPSRASWSFRHRARRGSQRGGNVRRAPDLDGLEPGRRARRADGGRARDRARGRSGRHELGGRHRNSSARAGCPGPLAAEHDGGHERPADHGVPDRTRLDGRGAGPCGRPLRGADGPRGRELPDQRSARSPGRRPRTRPAQGRGGRRQRRARRARRRACSGHRATPRGRSPRAVTTVTSPSTSSRPGPGRRRT